jgi:hypothetical protein
VPVPGPLQQRSCGEQTSDWQLQAVKQRLPAAPLPGTQPASRLKAADELAPPVEPPVLPPCELPADDPEDAAEEVPCALLPVELRPVLAPPVEAEALALLPCSDELPPAAELLELTPVVTEEPVAVLEEPWLLGPVEDSVEATGLLPSTSPLELPPPVVAVPPPDDAGPRGALPQPRTETSSPANGQKGTLRQATRTSGARESPEECDRAPGGLSIAAGGKLSPTSRYFAISPQRSLISPGVQLPLSFVTPAVSSMR